MKYFVKIFVIFTYLFFTNISYSATELAYINMEKIMNQSIAGKSITKALEDLHIKNIEEFKKIENELKLKENEIVSQKNILQEEEYKKKINLLKEQVVEYRKERRAKIELLNKKKIEATSELLKNIRPILAEYATQNSISIIIQKKNIIVGKKELEITDDILNSVNKKVKKIKLN